VGRRFVRGVPRPNPERYPADRGQKLHGFRALAVPIETVRANFARYGLRDEQVMFLQGWFRDTLPIAPIEKLAILRLDGDLYVDDGRVRGALRQGFGRRLRHRRASCANLSTRRRTGSTISYARPKLRRAAKSGSCA
jgi:hypothetical protein